MTEDEMALIEAMIADIAELKERLDTMTAVLVKKVEFYDAEIAWLTGREKARKRNEMDWRPAQPRAVDDPPEQSRAEIEKEQQHASAMEIIARIKRRSGA